MRLAEELKESPEYRLAFADRVQKHFFNDGALTSAAVAARWMKRAAEVDQAEATFSNSVKGPIAEPGR
jgi:hypothetical protein